MDHTAVQSWLDRYVEAWQTYDRGQIGDLFSEAAEYRYHPWDEPVSGREAIVRAWIAPDGSASGRDEPGTYDAKYRPWVVEGNRAVAVGESRYWTDASRSTMRQTYDNVFLLEFDADGRCRSFTEYYIQRKV